MVKVTLTLLFRHTGLSRRSKEATSRVKGKREARWVAWVLLCLASKAGTEVPADNLAFTWIEISVGAKESGAAQVWKKRKGEGGDQKL